LEGVLALYESSFDPKAMVEKMLGCFGFYVRLGNEERPGEMMLGAIS
jgi:hypothetical protein